MTTQNTHHEHNDVDQSVVEYPSTSETATVDSTTSDNRSSPEIQSEATRLTEEQAGTPVNSKTEQDTKDPSASNRATTHTQVLSQNPASSERVDQTGSSTDMQAIPEISIPSKIGAYGGEILQAEVKLSAVLDEAPVPPDEEKYGEAEQNQNEGVTGSEEKPTRLETEPARVSLSTEKAQVGVEQTSLPTVSVSIDAPVTVQQSEQKNTQPDLLPEEGEISTLAAAFSGTDGMPAQSGHATETSSSFPYQEIAPLINTKAEEVRPFTKFIEEFRLAEAARLQSALRESQVEAFALLNSVETISSVDTSTEKLVTSENGEDTEITEGTLMHAEAKQPLNPEPKETSATEQKPIINPANRPVSPLLRPATRLRVPRHGLVRHPREDQQTDDVTVSPLPKSQVEIKEVEATNFPTPVSEPVPPKPARRYRFDRPSSNPTNVKNRVAVPGPDITTASPILNASEGVQPTVPAPAVNAGFTQDKDITNRGASLVPPAPVQEQVEVSPEVKIQTEPTTSTPEQGRRRHVHKEPTVPTPRPAVETPMPVAETGVNTDQIAPEDLPPLEYSELQKASNSRRRRRHRSGSGSIPGPIVNITNEPAAPVKPVPSSSSNLLSSQIPSMPQMPPAAPIQTPAASYPNPTTNGVYNIVSGYTLNQMNQGNEIVGPFMGPEPSPARGSILSRDGRAARAETHRTSSGFATRPAEHGLHGPSAASMAQFANIVSQAIQTQTDRMVAELRRANQAPTNVSVNLPQFPSTERVGVFVDVANLLYSARTLRIAVDFGKLLDFLRGNRRLVRAHAYCPTSPQPGDEQMFLQAVKGLGYRITTKNYKTFSSGAKKADLDLDLCMDVVRLVDGRAVDCIVLVSGDSDFMPMLDYCSDHGVRVEVAAFDEAMSATLRQSCDLFVNLSMLEEIRA